MKKMFLIGCIGLVSCSSSKYAANFQPYKSNSGYGELKVKGPALHPVEPEQLYASTERQTIVVTQETQLKAALEQAHIKYSQMNKTERKQFRHDLKKEIKTYIKEKKEMRAARHDLDRDVKLAIIFGAIGITLLLVGTTTTFVISILGAIALIIGVVFLIKWLERQ